MAALKVDYKVAKSSDEAYELAKAQITPEYIDKFNVKADINYEPSQAKITAKGKGFTFTLHFKENATEVDIELSFLLKALKGKILETIERKLSKHV